MSPVEEIVLREVALPLRAPFAAAHGTVENRRLILLELRAADGASAWSECVALPEPTYTPETVDTAWIAIGEWIAPKVLGFPFATPRALHPVLDAGVRGHPMARAAVEMGVWALEAERRGLSLAALLGGSRAHVETGIAIGLEETPEAVVERVRAAVEEGYSRVKLKIAVGFDVEPLRAVREAFPDLALWADANSAYRHFDARELRVFDELDLGLLEQPLAWDDLLRHAELQRQIRTPICLDESVDSPDRAHEMIALGSGRILNLKPGRVGGLAAAKEIHDLCLENGVPLWCGGMLESGIGRAYNVALAALAGFTLPGDLAPSARYWRRDLVTPEWTMDARGRVEVPFDRPGIGVDVDRDRVDDLTVRRRVLRA